MGETCTPPPMALTIRGTGASPTLSGGTTAMKETLVPAGVESSLLLVSFVGLRRVDSQLRKSISPGRSCISLSSACRTSEGSGMMSCALGTLGRVGCVMMCLGCLVVVVEMVEGTVVGGAVDILLSASSFL